MKHFPIFIHILFLVNFRYIARLSVIYELLFFVSATLVDLNFVFVVKWKRNKCREILERFPLQKSFETGKNYFAALQERLTPFGIMGPS